MGKMKKVIWKVQALSLPHALRYCKKCGKKTTFVCSERFRVNAQRRSLDLWLIYNCANCNTTWNATVYSRIAPQLLTTALLDGFHHNDRALVLQYAMDRRFLQHNGAEASLSEYAVVGEDFILGEAIELEIQSKYALPVKVSSIIRGKLKVSRKIYLEYIAKGKMTAFCGRDLRNCKLNHGLVLIFK